MNSNSDESIKSSATSDDGTSGETGATCSDQQISLVAEFDDLMRFSKQLRCDDVEDKFLEFVTQTKFLNSRLQAALAENRRLQSELETKLSDCHDLERRLTNARKLLDKEKKHVSKLEEERDILEVKITRAADLLFHNNNNKNYLPDETRQQLAFLNGSGFNFNEPAARSSGNGAPHLSMIQEGHTTGSLLSDFSCSMSEDGLDSSTAVGTAWKKHRPSCEGVQEPSVKRRRSGNSKFVEINSNDKVRATTTLTVEKNGPITATSVIESVPPKPPRTPKSPAREVFTQLNPSAPPEHLVNDVWQKDSPRGLGKFNNRHHNFQSKTIVVPEQCGPCGKRIRFAKNSYKCKDCRAVCHPECKDKVPLPCIPLMNTPTQQGMLGLISDYTPAFSPMVPALIVHCTNEIELKGLKELGLYRVPGSEKEVKMLKEKFVKGKSAPCLNAIDVHVLCGAVKDFLRSLREPLVTHARWADFVRAVETKDEKDIPPVLFQIISELPQPNRDTLAHMILHLRRISLAPECKMPIKNLSRVFAPTIIGYSSADPDPCVLINETRQQGMVMESLLNLPEDYWESLLQYNDAGRTPSHGLMQTPSTDSLLFSAQGRSNIFSTPRSLRQTLKRKERYFMS